LPNGRDRTPETRLAEEGGWTADAPRSSGVLLHPTSLPGGRLGAEAYRFVDWLGRAGQRWWQVLPLNPPDEHGSPYASASAFAASPALLAEPDAPVSAEEAARFRGAQAYWIDDWAVATGPGAVEDQVRFEREWGALRRHAAGRGVQILGDVPFFVSARSADVAAHPRLFRRDLVAGVPPDAYAADGQLWGNPTYRWGAMRADGFRWWTERLRRVFEQVDVARLDHFRAMVAFWGVPADAPTARYGRWRRSPGRELVRAARAELGPLRLVAEDLGHITRPVDRLRHELGLPGIRVVQFAFDGSPRNPHLPRNHPEDAVAYPGTHDNDTSAGWWASAGREERERAAAAIREAGIEEREPAWALLRLALSSPARLAIVPAQDLLGLGSKARMNTPGTEGGNWSWRLPAGALDGALAARLRAATDDASRLRADRPG
jgi:4-alpha-glucanotransferase